MISEQNYKYMYDFQNELLKLYLNRPHDELIKCGILRSIEHCFGYRKSIFGFLGNINERTLSPNISCNGVDMNFSQAFIKELWLPDTCLSINSDQSVFSAIPSGKKSRLYKNLMRENGISDFVINFIYLPGKTTYVAYIIIFKEEGSFEKAELELINMMSEPISIAEDNYLKLWNLQNTMKLLQSATNFFPLGIMIIENLDNVTYTNDLAREYLKELGYPDPRFYNTFYLNELYRHFQYDVLNFGASKPIRINRFLFNIQTITNPGKILANVTHLTDQTNLQFKPYDSTGINYREITTCVYIVSDKNYKANMNISKATMEKIGLTNRERQVVDFIIRGISNQEISEKMFISINTVKIHVSNIFRKAGVRSRTELIDKLYNLEKES
ncbi:MAG: response regulator transcription factor [Christensenellales bacterium]|jgi:DNA-binding CsgD family transcriptional regulator